MMQSWGQNDERWCFDARCQEDSKEQRGGFSMVIGIESKAVGRLLCSVAFALSDGGWVARSARYSGNKPSDESIDWAVSSPKEDANR